MTRLARQIDIIDSHELEFPIHIIGCGGIGSWTALLLAKMGCSNIYLYDNDIVEDHNVASQFFKESQLKQKKTDALAYNIKEQTGVECFCTSNEMEANIKEGLVIIAVDSMAERIKLNDLFKDKNVFIIDGRMGGLQLEIYCNQMSTYVATLTSPDTVSHDLCTARSICFNCATIGSLIANFVRKYAKKELKDCSIIFDFNSITLLRENI